MKNGASERNGAIPVPLLDLKAQYDSLRKPIEAAIREVCESQQFILGPQVGEFEDKVAEYSQSRHAIGVSSGTDALLVALMAIGVGQGDEVVTSAYAFFASAGAISRLGARPVFCDIDADTCNIDPGAVASFLEADCRRKGDQLVNVRTGAVVKAIVPVHLFGQMADMTALSELAQRHRLSLIEDAAQAIGAETPDGRRAGSIGDIGCFSFFPSKNLGAFGDAGMCVTQSDELAAVIRRLRVHGADRGGDVADLGGNFRLDTLQAAVLNVKFHSLEKWTEARRENASRYDRYFNDTALPLQTPRVHEGFRHIYNQYVIDVAQRDPLKDYLAERNIGTAVYYPVPLHRQTYYARLGYRQASYPVAERAAMRTLALPVYPEMTSAQQEHVMHSIDGFYRR
ncbi:MAG: DegT/DnrJ/EryC1/StrS family aminotransferase [Woeseia sp.]